MTSSFSPISRSHILLNFVLLLISAFFFLLNMKLSISQTASSNTVNTHQPHEVNKAGDKQRRTVLRCYENPGGMKVERKSTFWVYYNFVMGDKKYSCNESVTFTTQGDLSHLSHLEALVQAWKGPVSVALYAPRTDFAYTFKAIIYYRKCSPSHLIRKYVTFHLFFDMHSIPSRNATYWAGKTHLLEKFVNCSRLYKEVIGSRRKSFRELANLDYPINVARNIARESAKTHFVLPSDIDLIPSPKVIKSFLNLIRTNPKLVPRMKSSAFVLPSFEMKQDEDQRLPEKKVELKKAIEQGRAVWLNAMVCFKCQLIPGFEEWLYLREEVDEPMTISKSVKRVFPYDEWDPMFIASKDLPLWDEKHSWEGKGHTDTVPFQMCLTSYTFHILGNAFLLRRASVTFGGSSGTKPEVAVPGSAGDFRHWPYHTQNLSQLELEQMYGQIDVCTDRHQFGQIKSIMV